MAKKSVSWSLIMVMWLATLPVHPVEGFAPLGAGVSVGMSLTAAGLYAGYEYLKCKYKECCDPKWIKPNIGGLASDFTGHLHGQHLVEDIVLKALRIHFNKGHKVKPLVMSFHGWTGGGKNFVSNLIAKNIYKEGLRSKFLHLFIANVHFKHQHMAETYKDELTIWIKGNVSECGLSMFVFDEVDKMPLGVMDAVKPFVDYYDNIDGVDFRKSIFIFLSNTGGAAITEKALQFWQEGKKREDITYQDLEELICKGAFNEKGNIKGAFDEKGGLLHAHVIEKSLVDYYVPFLPLERKHVELCVRDELEDRGVFDDDAQQKFMKKVTEKIPFYPDDTKLFSKVGCKRVAQMVDYEMED